MEFYLPVGLHLNYSLSIAPHPVDILGSPGGCLKSVWDSWAYAHRDSASVHPLPSTARLCPAGCQPFYCPPAGLEAELCSVPWPPADPTQKWIGVCLAIVLCWERPQPGVDCCGSTVLQFDDTAFPALFILLSRASLQHQDNWARVASNNSLCAELRVITPFDS